MIMKDKIISTIDSILSLRVKSIFLAHNPADPLVVPKFTCVSISNKKVLAGISLSMETKEIRPPA